ncbi:unnamed protein product [Dracunculus medinensis]|uniref:GLOBIN domain-containing protein n=1 Tax=Dracunculus medinensis TaxID=318479 RepID=A0A158Q658_DRAME|nr:unnamed protein product [Dracunculus medinensis]
MVEKIDEVGKNSLRESWLYLTQDIERISIRIFESIFQKCPEAKKMFPFMVIEDFGDEKRSAGMRFHALRFMQSRNFKIEYFDIFHEATLIHFKNALNHFPASRPKRKHSTIVAGNLNISYTIELWDVVLKFLIDAMKLSLLQGLQERQTFSHLQNMVESDNKVNRKPLQEDGSEKVESGKVETKIILPKGPVRTQRATNRPKIFCIQKLAKCFGRVFP